MAAQRIKTALVCPLYRELKDLPPMALPTDENVDFLVCDVAQQRPDGKIDLTGFYPTGEIKVDPNAQLPASMNLAFVFVLKDGAGDFRVSFRLYDPLGKELTHNPLPNIKKPSDQGQTLWVNLGQIPVVNLGHYAVELAIDDQRYRRTIRIIQ
ncbi:MAG TPA: hypothetical protein VET89_01945 [Stellaceae bacterium]|nr:hypothetical protein [Stellaceae bacterium]